MKQLLGFASALELATGLALLAAPGLTATWLLGDGLTGAGMAIGRLAGAGLLALGLACWPGGEHPTSSSPAFRAMLTYNALIAIYLASVGIRTKAVGMLLWPAVVLHVVLTVLLIHAWLRGSRSSVGVRHES
jgi:hypothetical protein